MKKPKTTEKIEFKIGDRVRVAAGSTWNTYNGHIGREGTITAIRVSPDNYFPDLYTLDFMAEEPPTHVYRIEPNQIVKI